MNPDASVRSGLHPSIVLSAYVEPLVRGRRVAILGDASIRLADELSQRGARLVHVYDPDTARTAEALAKLTPGRPHQVAYAVLAGDLGVRDGAFDVVVVPDLALFTDPAEVLRRARRLCSPAGVAVFVTPNAAAGKKRLLAPARAEGGAAPLGYYELYDLVSLQFAKVRMIGQAPFVGYTVADFSPRGEPEVSVDTSLLTSSEEPEHFIALASDRPVSLDAYAVIELPWHDVAEALATRDARDPAREAAEARVTDLNAELTALRAQVGEQAREAEARALGAAALSARVAELEGEIAAREGKLREVEGRAGDNHVRAERLTNQIRDLDEELRRQRDRGTKLSKLLDDEKKGRTKAEVELGMLRGAPGSKERIDALTAELGAAQARISDLEMEAAETRRRPTAPPAALPPDPALMTRIGELEKAVSSALRDLADTAAQRDAAFDRARRAEARVAELGGLSARTEAAAEEERAELAERARASAAEVTDLERRLLAERERATTTARMAADAAHRLVEAEKHAAEAGARAARLAHSAGEAEQRAAEMEARLGEQDRRLGELAAQIAAAQAVGRAAGEEHEALAAAESEMAGLEAALLERGHVIAALTRDLREAERVGRELLGELAGGSNGVVVAPGDVDLRGRLDALAASAARAEADLQAASWRIAQLERELGEARRATGQPERAQIELEEARAAAASRRGPRPWDRWRSTWTRPGTATSRPPWTPAPSRSCAR